MFTGLIQSVGRLSRRVDHAGGQRLWIDAGPWLNTDPQIGESIAVAGVCLTAVVFDGESFAADLAEETLALTTLGQLPQGAALNLERALLPTTRLGGHLVSGHVDGVARVRRITSEGAGQRWYFDVPLALQRYIAVKGSICVDGVSLTVTHVDTDGFAVALVPHTIAHTSFSSTAVGQSVNLEVDQLARYMERLLEMRFAAGPIGAGPS